MRSSSQPQRVPEAQFRGRFSVSPALKLDVHDGAALATRRGRILRDGGNE